MAQKRLTIDYQEYASMAEMEEADRSLLERAVKATKGSYAPFSHYNVGAAVLLSDGTVVQGANQENLRRADRPLRGPCAVSPFARKGHCHNSLPRRPYGGRAGLALRSLPSGPRRVPEKSRGPRPCHRGRPQPYCRIFLCGGYSSVYFQRTIGRKGRRQRDSAHLHRKA